MRNKKNGFIYPLTLGFFFLVLLFLFIITTLFLNVKGTMNEAKVISVQEYYFMRSINELEKLLLEESTPPASGTFYFSHGIVSYQLTQPSPEQYRIDYTLTMEPDYQVYGISYYHTVEKRMTKWVEAN